MSFNKGKYHCDNCEEEIVDGVTIEVNFWVGSIHAGEKRDFCSDICFATWAINGTPQNERIDCPTERR